MKRFFINIMLVALAATTMVACHNDAAIDNPQPEKEQVEADGSLVNIKLGVKIPDPIKVATRAVDPDGNGIQTMTLFCFDRQGLLISTATATLEPDPNDPDNEAGGILDADIPNTTRVIHLLANQNMSQFKEDDFRNLSEDQVIADLEGSSGMMIYWARVEVPESVTGNDGILEWFTVMTDPTGDPYYGEGQPIIMLRNQAKVMVDAGGTTDDVEKDWEGDHFKVEGFTVVNTQAFGTVAPYHTSYGYPTYACTSSQAATANFAFTPSFGLTTGSTANWRDENYVNLPRKSDKFSNITDVATAAETYVFETENSSADPVSVIIKGQNIVGGTPQATKYYRVTLTDSEGEQVLVRRNHLYTVNIKGNLLYGVDTFGEALDAPATNNVWLSISDEVKSVQNGDYKLTVDQTSVVLDEVEWAAINSSPKQITLGFSVEALGSRAIYIDDLSISWVGSQDISNSNLTGANEVEFNISGQTATGKIFVPLNGFTSVTNEKYEGTVLVKYGHLQRKIKVMVVKEQDFTPTWVTGQVYTQAGTSGEEVEAANATLVFTIPEECPAELFPMQVLISTNELDVRSSSGQVLPIIRQGEEGYGEDNGIGYKYIYEVTEPGKQFLYLRSILGQTAGASTEVTIEAEHFNPVTKLVVYANSLRAISVTNLWYYEGSFAGATNESDKIYYIYLPQKRSAAWAIDLQMIELEDYGSIEINEFDEFLLYSDNLDAYSDTEYDRAKTLLPGNAWLSNHNYFPCQFVAVDESLWGTGGRVHAFMPRNQYHTDGNSKSTFSIFMKTNKAKSAEIIRISSNQLEAKAAFTADSEIPAGSTVAIYGENTSDTYLYKNKGEDVNTYRSMVFELRNYPAFRFAAQVDGVPAYDTTTFPDLSDNEEEETPVQIGYAPGTAVEVAFDVTSFAVDGTDVNPFGEDVVIYIQTPGLEVVREGLPVDVSNKIKQVDDSGLYRYTVDNERSEEAEDWSTTALQTTTKGERKVITFKTKDIVTEGDIVIYTDPDQVSYKSKTFNVTNAPITGSITYAGTSVPAGQFISFSREIDGSRIGSLTVTEDGKYQLRLRKEYEFTWDQTDPVKLYAKIGENYYVATYANLKALANAPDINLTLEGN